MHKRRHQLALVTLFLLGVSGPLSMFIHDYNPLFFISPAPSVFTYQKKYKNQISFVRHSNAGRYDELVMDRAFYKKLKGPHRYKVIFNSVMKRGGRLVKLPQYENFIKKFVCVYSADARIGKVEVFNGKKQLKVFSCYE